MLNRATLQNRPSSQQLLRRVLETPHLAAEIQALPGVVLGKLINQVGLSDAGELVALASSEQLAQIFDEDLWLSERPGQDERFDSGRFLLWLEVMLEAGERFVAERLAELPQDVLTLAFARHVLVLSFDDLREELTAGDNAAEAAEKAFESCLSEELDDYQLIWRGGDGWDSLLTALLAFDRDHHDLVVDLLERAAHLSREHIDDNGGLYEVLSADEMLEGDLAAEREARRAERGYVAPSAAAGFLRLALGDAPPDERDALTRAYFRDLARKPAPGVTSSPKSQGLSALLQAAGVSEQVVAPRLPALASQRAEPLLIAALRELAGTSPERFAERSEELAYLSNVLMAGASASGERLRPLAAVEQAVDVVSLGLSLACSGSAPAPAVAATVLARSQCDVLFRQAIQVARRRRLEAGQKTDARLLSRVRALLKTLKV